jgi:hypothetical protein
VASLNGFRSPRRFSSPASLVCMLPLSFRAFSEPPGRHPPAPGSQVGCSRPKTGGTGPGVIRLSAALAAFRRSAFSSRVPSVDLSHSLAFDSLTPCEVGDILGLHATPVPFRLDQSPLAAVLPRQAPASIALSRYRWSFVVGWVRLVFSALSRLPVQSITPCGPIRI